MPTDLDVQLRDHALSLDAEASPVTLAEIGALAADSEFSATRHGRRMPTVLVAASFVVVAGIGIGWQLLGGASDETVRTPATEPVASTTPPGSPTTLATAPTPVHSTLPATTIAVAVIETSVADEVATAPGDVSFAELRAAQGEALSALDAFSVTVGTSGFFDASGIAPPSVHELSMRPDGSFWVSGDDGSWSSFDASNGTIRGREIEAAGDFWQLVSAQRSGQFALQEAIGHDPTVILDDWVDPVSITGTVRSGRPGWDVESSYEMPGFDSDGPDGSVVSFPAAVVSEHRFVDSVTGLVLEYRRSSSAYPDDVQESVMTDLALGAELPAEFPGVVPDDVFDINEGGAPAPEVSAVDAAGSFGIAIPVPTLDGTVVVIFDEGEAGTTDSDEAVGVHREVRFERRRGFVTTTVTIGASTLFDPADLLNDYALVDGYTCFDLDDDLVCDPNPVEQADLGLTLSTVESGALAGAEIVDHGDWLIVSTGPFMIDIGGAPRDELFEIVNSFELVSPPG